MKKLQLIIASIVAPSGVRGLLKSIYCLAFLLLATALVAHADTGTPSDPGGDPSAPIDGGLSLLVAAGMGYGAKRLKEKRQQQPTK